MAVQAAGLIGGLASLGAKGLIGIGAFVGVDSFSGGKLTNWGESLADRLVASQSHVQHTNVNVDNMNQGESVWSKILGGLSRLFKMIGLTGAVEWAEAQYKDIEQSGIDRTDAIKGRNEFSSPDLQKGLMPNSFDGDPSTDGNLVIDSAKIAGSVLALDSTQVAVRNRMVKSAGTAHGMEAAKDITKAGGNKIAAKQALEATRDAYFESNKKTTLLGKLISKFKGGASDPSTHNSKTAVEFSEDPLEKMQREKNDLGESKSNNNNKKSSFFKDIGGRLKETKTIKRVTLAASAIGLGTAAVKANASEAFINDPNANALDVKKSELVNDAIEATPFSDAAIKALDKNATKEDVARSAVVEGSGLVATFSGAATVGTVGATKGAALGATIGTFIAPGPGTAIGAAVVGTAGGVAGGIAGAAFGEAAVEEAVNWTWGKLSSLFKDEATPKGFSPKPEAQYALGIQ